MPVRSIDDNVGRLRSKLIYVFDLDGTLVLGNKPVRGADILIRRLIERNAKILVLSNNSSITPKELLMRLINVLGLNEEYLTKIYVYTSVDYYVDEILRRGLIKCGYYLLPKNVINYYKSLRVTSSCNTYEAVIVGFDTELTYDKLVKASLLLKAGAKFYLINPDITCPTHVGEVPDAGAIAKLLTLVTGRKPDWIGGKPSEGMLKRGLKTRLGLSINSRTKDLIVYAGDRVNTDLSMAVKLGIDMMLIVRDEKLITYLNSLRIPINVYIIRDWLNYVRKVL